VSEQAQPSCRDKKSGWRLAIDHSFDKTLTQSPALGGTWNNSRKKALTLPSG